MAIAVRSSTVVNSNSNSATAVRPAGSVAGDLLLLFGIEYDTTSFDASGFTTPTGWTTIAAQDVSWGNSNNNQISTFWRVADGTATDLPFMQGNGTSESVSLVIAAITGANNSSPIDQAGTQTKGSALTAQVAPSITTANAGSLLVNLWSTMQNAGGSGRSYSGFGTDTLAVQSQLTAAPWGYCALATQVMAAAGATGTRTATSSSALGASDYYLATSLAINASAGTPTTYRGGSVQPTNQAVLRSAVY